MLICGYLDLRFLQVLETYLDSVESIYDVKFLWPPNMCKKTLGCQALNDGQGQTLRANRAGILRESQG